MQIRLVTPDGVHRREVDDLPGLLAHDDGVLWVDLPEGDPDAAAVLSDVFGFHPMAVQDCIQRNPIPKVHVYPDHVFVVLHGPEPGRRPHPLRGARPVRGAALPRHRARPGQPGGRSRRGPGRDRRRRGSAGRRRFRPTSGPELSTAVVAALTGRMRAQLSARTSEVWRFEQQVTAGQLGDAEQFLDGMFRVRHGLLTVRTMASLSHEVYGRMHALSVFGEQGRPMLENNMDQFQRLATMARSQEDYLQGVIEFYQTRTNTKMTIAAERLAVIAAVTLPITALSSVMGMNVIVNSRSDPAFIAVLVAGMAVLSVILLVWAKRHGWW